MTGYEDDVVMGDDTSEAAFEYHFANCLLRTPAVDDAAQLQDSLTYYSEPVWERRGAIGVNIGAAFLVFFAVCALVPLTVGIILYLVYRYRKRQYQRSTML